MYSQEAVRSLPHEKRSKYFILIARKLRDLRYRGGFLAQVDSQTLASTLSAVERTVGLSRQAHQRFLAGANPSPQGRLSAQSAASTLRRRLFRIEDLATKAAGEGPSAEAAQVKVLELDGDRRFARTLAAQGRLARADRWPALVLNRLSEAAKLVHRRRTERQGYASSHRVCI